MTGLDTLGLVATAFTTSSFVPQVWRTWKTRDVSGISLSTYLLSCCMTACVNIGVRTQGRL